MSIRDLPGFLHEAHDDDTFFSDPAHLQRQASLSDLSWMDVPSAVVFGQRRQGEPPLDTAATLRAFWDKNLPRMGPIVDPAEYSPDLETPKNPAAFQQSLRLASQRVHFGEAVDQVVSDLAAQVGEERAAKVAPLLARDEGLAGRVFIRLAAFPGGLAKWAEVLRRRCASARYVLDVAERPLRKSEASGRMLRVVASIPWNEAYREYAPGLRSAGAPLPLQAKNPARALQAAFLWVERDRIDPRGRGPTVAVYQRQGSSWTPPPAAASAPAAAPADMRVRRQVEALAERNILDHKTAASLLALPLLREEVVAKVVRDITAAAARGTPYQGDGIRLRGVSMVSRPAMKPAAPVPAAPARSKRASAAPAPAAPAPKPYAGPIYSTLPVETVRASVPGPSAVDRIASSSGLFPADVRTYLQWARTAVARGLQGSALEAETAARWPAKLVQACEPVVRSIRAIHEGRAGVSYVYADAHLTPNSAKGCIAEARRLRVVEGPRPQVVLASSRCAGCTNLANLPGQGPTCLVYGLRVVNGSGEGVS